MTRFDPAAGARYELARMPTVTFLNEQLTVETEAGVTLLAVAERHGVNLFRGLFQGVRCGGRVRGVCRRCRVWATGSLPPKTPAETGRLRLAFGAPVPVRGTMRLACLAIVDGDVEVRTRAGYVIPPSLEWSEDPRAWRWKERWAKRDEELAAPAATDAAAAKAKVAKAKPAPAPKDGGDGEGAGS